LGSITPNTSFNVHVGGKRACNMQGALVFCKENTNEFQSVF
jgi:hypothetical protein